MSVRQREKNIKLAWHKSLAGLATKKDLKKWKEQLAMKVSELSIREAATEKKLIKIFKEQQKNHDQLVKEIELLKSQLKDGDVPEEAVATQGRIDALLETQDALIPDLDEEPAAVAAKAKKAK